jgi:copine 1/2/3
VDYTASNQDPRSPNSLHFMGGRMNHYQNAMATIGNIVMDYTTTASVAALGFGAKLLNEQKGVNHCFPLTFDPNNTFVNGVNGMLGAYAHSFGQLRLSGPTYFSDIINCASGLATSLPYSASEQHYSILLILTDGIINDMPKTISSIVAASDKPLSIIIVGVGNGADWAAMEELDGDGKMLQAPTGQYALRDIVQFVPMEKCLRMGLPALARETLAEVPNQVTSFMRLHKISPMVYSKPGRKTSCGSSSSDVGPALEQLPPLCCLF